jgi:hypothetical protein
MQLKSIRLFEIKVSQKRLGRNMKTQLALLFTAMTVLSGCSTTTVERTVKDGVNGAINGILGSTSPSSPVTNTPNQSGNYSVRSENISIITAEKTSRDYGQTTITKAERNPNDKTILKIGRSFHPRIGNVAFEAYLYEYSPEGWLINTRTKLDTTFNENITLPAGKYYIKAQTRGVDRKSYATGTITIDPFVSNYITLEFE